MQHHMYDSKEFVDSISRLPIKDYYIVTGPPGVRTDLVVGWLSSMHPSFHSNQRWTIDPVTGSSVLWPHPPTNPVDIDRQVRIDRIKSVVSIFLPKTSSGAEKSVVMKSHMEPAHLIEAIPESIFLKDFKIVSIDITSVLTDEQLCRKISWEFLAKTWLSKTRMNPHIKNIDEIKNRQMPINRLFHIGLDKYAPEIKNRIIFLDYKRIIDDDGGAYICEKLGIDPEPGAIKRWKEILPLTHTPEQLIIDGKIWSYDLINS